MSCITLLSDLSLQDASVAIAKGILMQYVPDTPLIDISHEVTPFNVRQAAYLLASVYKNFPVGSVHLALCDIFSEKNPRLAICALNGCYFLAPDNGILPLALGSDLPAWESAELVPGATYTDWLHTAGKIISELQQQKKPSDLKVNPIPLKHIIGSTTGIENKDLVNCEVMHIDQYENVVINITKQQFENLANGRNFWLHFMLVEEINELSSSYNDVRPGFKLCRFNSSGYMEICVNRGKAASLFGIRLGGKYNDIKINFE